MISKTSRPLLCIPISPDSLSTILPSPMSSKQLVQIEEAGPINQGQNSNPPSNQPPSVSCPLNNRRNRQAADKKTRNDACHTPHHRLQQLYEEGRS